MQQILKKRSDLELERVCTVLEKLANQNKNTSTLFLDTTQGNQTPALNSKTTAPSSTMTNTPTEEDDFLEQLANTAPTNAKFQRLHRQPLQQPRPPTLSASDNTNSPARHHLLSEVMDMSNELVSFLTGNITTLDMSDRHTTAVTEHSKNFHQVKKKSVEQ